MRWEILFGAVTTLLLVACGEQTSTPASESTEAQAGMAAAPTVPRNLDREAYFGDIHVHSTFSFDAFIFGTRADPDAAYRFARGEVIKHPAGFDMQLSTPLDFQMVSDHAAYLGMLPAMMDPDSPAGRHAVGAAVRNATTPVARNAAFQAILPRIRGRLDEPDDLLDLEVVKSAWQEIIASAERSNEPGKFTAFIGYEYTASGPEAQNLHRNVVFRGSRAPEIPFSRLDSTNPEDLWNWMDALRAEGIDGLAVPHNSNGSGGWMFETTNQAGEAIDRTYAEQRMRNEPLAEITQVKGTSDTHPALSPNDEWADFEIMPVRIASTRLSEPPGSYVRDAYLRGLALEESRGINPYRFGVIGSSDTHVAAGSFEENNYWSKIGLLDATPEQRGSVPLETPDANGNTHSMGAPRYWGASGLAGVWAESNTREDIFDAFRRKETFATTGPRIRVRFFGGYHLDDDLQRDPTNVAAAYRGGVPMGGQLQADRDKQPAFLVWAVRDSASAPLQRVQVIKGWVSDGEHHERVYDVACSDGLAVDSDTRRCPDNGARVDLTTCAISPDKGASQLYTMWRDPDFVAGERALYYVRVLENPTCRWSTWDAIRAGATLREDMHATIQERAWSSPIWYVP